MKRSFEKLNDLPAEIKLQIVNAQQILEEAETKAKLAGLSIDLTYRWQIRDDIKALEKILDTYAKGKYDEKKQKQLNACTTRLKTTIDHVFKE